MPRRTSVSAADANAATWSGAATNYIVQANNGYYYLIYIDWTLDVCFRKSLDGINWGPAVLACTAGSTTQLAVWYDRWSNLSSDYICIALADSGNDDIMFRTINTGSSDALSTQTIVFAGASTAAGGHMSVVRAVGGNTYIKGVIDAGAEGGFYRLPVANFPSGAWDAARTVDEVIATLDQMLLLPDFDAADTQDIMALFQDASVTELSRKLYDDSANTWSETSIDATITELSTATAFPNFDAAPDIANTQHVVVAWSATDAASQDLRCWTVDASTITAKTDVVANATDDCGLCAIGIDTATGYWHVFYGGKSDGSETWNTALNIYTKVSRDSGSTWGPETKMTESTADASTLRWLITCPRFTKPPIFAFVRDGAVVDDLRVNVDMIEPRAINLIGV